MEQFWSMKSVDADHNLLFSWWKNEQVHQTLILWGMKCYMQPLKRGRLHDNETGYSLLFSISFTFPIHYLCHSFRLERIRHCMWSWSIVRPWSWIIYSREWFRFMQPTWKIKKSNWTGEFSLVQFVFFKHWVLGFDFRYE